MLSKIRLIFFVVICFYSCQSFNNDLPKNSFLDQKLDNNKIIIKINEDTFFINNIHFKKLRNIDYSKDSFTNECWFNKTKKLKSNSFDTFLNSSYFLYDMFYRFKINDTNFEINTDLAEKFINKAGWTTENLLKYKIKIEKSKNYRIQNYGVCEILTFIKSDVNNSEQSKFLIIYNKKKSEISLLDFDNFYFKKDRLYVDFKMKNEHSQFQIDFCEKLDRFYFFPNDL